MKNISVFILLLAILGCSKSPEGFFTVTGTLKNAKSGDKIVLSLLSSNAINPVDSTFIDDKGIFTLKGFTTGPKFYILNTKGNNRINLLVDSAQTITITGDYADLSKGYSVEGSDECKLLAKLDRQILETSQKVDSLGKIYRVNMTNKNIDSIKAGLDKTFMEILQKQREFSIQFIEKNTSSLTCLLALAQYFAPNSPVFNFKEDKEYFEKVNKALMAKYPNSEDAKALNIYLEKKNSALQNNLPLDGEVVVGMSAPDISLPDPEGKTQSLSSQKGKYVLLDFWASWCRPCRDENPNLVKNYWKYKRSGFEIYQVSLDQTKEAWTAAILQDNLMWVHVSDLKYWQAAPAMRYGVRSIPSNFLLDKEGKIIAINLRGEELGKKLKDIFKF